MNALEEAQALQQQLANLRAEVQRKSREGQESRGALEQLEKRLQLHVGLFRWASARCAEALGEEPGHEPQVDGVLGTDPLEDGFKRVVGRTLTLLCRRVCSAAGEKENLQGAAVEGAPAPPIKASEATRRLASAQCELLRAQAENEELEAAQHGLRSRLGELEQALRTPRCTGLRTEQRGRVRAAEDAQRRLQRQLVELDEAFRQEREEHEEECEQFRGRVSALQRAKEAGERYIEAEEDTWVAAQEAAWGAEQAAASARAKARRAEAEACDAHNDAVEARAAAHAAEAVRRRLEADVAELRAAGAGGAGDQDCPGAALAMPRVPYGQENLDTQRTRLELHRRDEACVHEVMLAQRHAAEWHAAAERANSEMTMFRQMLEGAEATSRGLSRQWEAAMEQQQKQQAKVDEAKRMMVQSALDVQASTLRSEFLGQLEVERGRCEEETCRLRRCAAERSEQRAEIDSARHAVATLQHRTDCLEEELRQYGQRSEELDAAGRSAERLGCLEELAELRGAHAAQLAMLSAEYGGERAALRALEEEARQRGEEELACARAAQAELWQAVDWAVQGEAEEALAAQRACRSEALSARGRRVALREELRGELRAELHERLREELRAEVRNEIANDPCDELRRQLCRDLRQELRDQLRCELRSELRSEQRAGREGASPSSSTSCCSTSAGRHRTQLQQSPSVRSPSSIAVVSPSACEASPAAVRWPPAERANAGAEPRCLDRELQGVLAWVPHEASPQRAAVESPPRRAAPERPAAEPRGLGPFDGARPVTPSGTLGSARAFAMPPSPRAPHVPSIPDCAGSLEEHASAVLAAVTQSRAAWCSTVSADVEHALPHLKGHL